MGVHIRKKNPPLPSAALSLKPPFHIWLAAILVACVRSLPFWLAVARPSIPGGVSYLPMGYIPKDWLVYVALIQQPASTGNWLLSIPFTTEPQSGRFLLLFHQFLGAIHAVSGISGFWLLELSRFPLTLLFFWVLWRFLGPILPDLRHRSWACWMVAFSGGVEFLLLSLSGLLPEIIRGTVRQDLWHYQGWNTFQTFYNPLWIAALTLTICILRPILQPNGPATSKDMFVIGLGIVLLWFTHPYSAIVVVTVSLSCLFLPWCLEAKLDWRSLRHTAVALVPAVIIVAAITIWQLQDPVFKQSSGNVFGVQPLSVFWYPVTLGGVGFFALRGWRKFVELKHPWRFGIAGWTLAVIFLHVSPILNGYHYVLYLHLPICIVAAPAVAEYFTSIRHAGHRNYLIGFLLVLLFSSSLSTTAASIVNLKNYRIETAVLELNNHLKAYPPGNVLAHSYIGNMIPALTPHRVYVGHWALTPDFNQRALQYKILTENPKKYEVEFKKLLASQQIRYLIVKRQFSENIESVLRARIKEKTAFGRWMFFHLKEP